MVVVFVVFISMPIKAFTLVDKWLTEGPNIPSVILLGTDTSPLFVRS